MIRSFQDADVGAGQVMYTGSDEALQNLNLDGTERLSSEDSVSHTIKRKWHKG